MVQVIVKREDQQATVECSEVKGYVIGNGPSREHIILDDLKKDGIVYGCNALYRDWEPDFLFANDFRMIKEIFKDDYKGQCIFSDLNVLPVQYFDDVIGGTTLTLSNKSIVKMNYVGDRENATDFVYMGREKEHDVLWLNSEENSNFEWGFKPLANLPSTGTMALLRAAQNGHKEIIMYGFDGLKNGNYQNVYDGTYLYKYDGRSIDGLRHPETYRPKAADEWEQNFMDIVNKYPDSKIEII